jgi:hypothetical protein
MAGLAGAVTCSRSSRFDEYDHRMQQPIN